MKYFNKNIVIAVLLEKLEAYRNNKNTCQKNKNLYEKYINIYKKIV